MILQSANEVIKEIKTHFSNVNSFKMVLIVNANNQQDYMTIKNSIADEVVNIKLSHFSCTSDDMPNVEDCLSTIRNTNQSSLILGLSQHWKLMGEASLDMGISNILSLKSKSVKVVFLFYNLEQRLQQYIVNDPRHESSICLLKGAIKDINKLYFINSSIRDLGRDNLVAGYSNYLNKFEDSCESNLIVSSVLHKNDFKDSLFDIKNIVDGFDLLSAIYNIPSCLTPSMGDNDYWTKLCDDIGQNTFYKYFEDKLGDLYNLHNLFFRWNEWTAYQKWEFFIGLQIGEVKDSYLRYVIEKSVDYNFIVENLFSSILDFDVEDKNYQSLYVQRKQILRHIKDLDALNTFIERLRVKGNVKIKYLTDLTIVEKEEIIDWLSKQPAINESIMECLSLIYNDLSLYLRFFDLKNEGFNNYFNLYKIQKINNKVYDNFLDLVNGYAISREYNKLLPTRNEAFEKIDKTNSTIYFIDALGVEFLGFISAICKKLSLSIDVTIAKANIPTTTYNNKDFLDGYKDILVEILDLDKLKHSGEKTYNYQKTKLPIHLPIELNLINDALEKIKSELSVKSKVILVSDHGASRLVVINNKKVNYDLRSNGTNGGRCCEYVEGMEIPEFATIENGQIALANYERFNSHARVETHGGATLEELIVPIIVITNTNDNITVILDKNIVESSFRCKPELKIYISKKLENIYVRINSKNYASARLEDDFHIIPIHDITRSGNYSAEVYFGDNHIGDVAFTIKKSETKERNYDI